MSDGASAQLPTIGRLFGNGLEHWLEHQRLFWAVTAPSALGLGALRFAVAAGWMKSGEPTGVIAILYALALSQWFRHMLYDDWTKRAALLGKDRRRRASIASLPFMAFCVGYGAALFMPGDGGHVQCPGQRLQ